MTGFPSFLDWITFHCTYAPQIFIDSSAFGHWAVFLSWLLYTLQQWTWGCRSLLDILVLSPLDINSGVIAASYDIVFLVIFSGTSTVFHNGYAILIILIPTNTVQKFYFSTSLLVLYIYIWCIYTYIHHNVHIYIYNVHPEKRFLLLTWFPFLWYWLILSTFPICIDHFNVFYEEMSIEALYTFFKLSYLPAVVFTLSCTCFLYILYIGPLFSYIVCRYFLSLYRSPFVDCWRDYSFFTW